jgi:type II secretory pathway pseudopilin PulG
MRRLLKEEAGMTMGLVVIMIVLIGVMGAGLLIFVQRDLNAVVEVNRGQKAIEVADAGIQAAKRQLLLNSYPESYNGNNSGDDSANKPESEWSSNSASATCGDLGSGPGKCIHTEDGDVRVSIRYLPLPASNAESGKGSRKDPNYAPEKPPTGATDYPDKHRYFRVESEGIFDDARRKIQAILVTEDLGLPKAYFATENISVRDPATTIANVSLFAGGNVTGVRDGMLRGKDLAYGDWSGNKYNNKARLGSSRATPANDPQAAGVGAEGSITYDPASYNRTQKDNPADSSDRYKRLDYDNDVSATAAPTRNNYRFCGKGTTPNACWPSTRSDQPPDVITYPFDVGAKPDADFLQSQAEEQVRPGTGSASNRDNYIEQPGSAGVVTIDESNFYQISPPLSSVLVVRFTGPTKGEVRFESHRPTGSPCLAGTIVVINGDFKTNDSGDRCFNGVVSLQDSNDLGTLEYANTGNFTLNGFVNVEGTMNIQGSVNPFPGTDALNSPGYHDVKLWSWRECYNETCA